MATKTPALTREKETLILDAAQKRFAVYGLGKVTMDEIAADVGMGKASLYYYFPTKEHLFRNVIAREQAEFMNRLKDILRLEIPASEKLKRYTEQRVEYVKTLLNLQFLNVSSYLNPKPMLRELFEAFVAEEQKRLTEVFREGKRNGEFEIKSPEATATLFLHVMQGLRLRLWKATNFSGVYDTETTELAREMGHLVDVFINGIRRR